MSYQEQKIAKPPYELGNIVQILEHHRASGQSCIGTLGIINELANPDKPTGISCLGCSNKKVFIQTPQN